MKQLLGEGSTGTVLSRREVWQTKPKSMQQADATQLLNLGLKIFAKV